MKNTFLAWQAAGTLALLLVSNPSIASMTSCPVAIRLRGLSPSTELVVPNRQGIPQTVGKGGVITEYPNFRVEHSPKLGIPRTVRKTGWVPPGAKTAFIFLHGMSGRESHHGGMFRFGDALIAAESELGLGPIAVELFDLPYHGLLSSDRPETKNYPTPALFNKFLTEKELIDLIAGEIKALREAGIEKVVVHGRSCGGPIAISIAKTYPQLVNAVTLVASVYSGPRLIENELVDALRPMYGNNNDRDALNLQGLVYAVSLMREIDLDQINWNEWSIPTWHIVSESDLEISPAALAEWRRLSSMPSGILKFHRLPTDGRSVHDVLSDPEFGPRATDSYINFIKTALGAPTYR